MASTILSRREEIEYCSGWSNLCAYSFNDTNIKQSFFFEYALASWLVLAQSIRNLTSVTISLIIPLQFMYIGLIVCERLVKRVALCTHNPANCLNGNNNNNILIAFFSLYLFCLSVVILLIVILVHCVFRAPLYIIGHGMLRGIRHTN